MKHLIFSLLFIATSLNLRGQDTIILKNNARMILDTTNMRTIPQFEEDLKLIDMKFIPSAQYDIFMISTLCLLARSKIALLKK